MKRLIIKYGDNDRLAARVGDEIEGFINVEVKKKL